MKSNKQAIIGLSMGHFVADLYASAIVPLYPLITQRLGITLASISLIISMGHLVSSMLQPLFGFFCRQNEKKSFYDKRAYYGRNFYSFNNCRSKRFFIVPVSNAWNVR